MNIYGNVYGNYQVAGLAPTPITGDEPFTLIYNGLWSLVESRAEFAVNIRAGNRIKYAVLNNRNPAKDQHSSTDLPEIILQTTGGNANLHADSNGSRFTVNYSWVLNTGEISLIPIHAYNFWLMRAMAGWQTVLAGLVWNGQTFVKKCGDWNFSMGLSNPEANSNIRGQTAVWTCSVELWISTALLKGA